jgi:hypothetical protein
MLALVQPKQSLLCRIRGNALRRPRFRDRNKHMPSSWSSFIAIRTRSMYNAPA